MRKFAVGAKQTPHRHVRPTAGINAPLYEGFCNANNRIDTHSDYSFD